jgi:hypothetical protein
MLIFGIFYLLILSVSLWAGWASIRIGYLPRANSIKTAIGLTCFYLCDISVILNLASGLDNAIVPSVPFDYVNVYPAWDGIQYIVHNITWIFYTPALMLIALSVYKTKLICYLKMEDVTR